MKNDPMDARRDLDLHFTRRQFFGLTAQGIGIGALASLLEPASLLAAGAQEMRDPKTHGLTTLPHFAAKAKRVIFLHQSGGPSQLETFDYKPRLGEFQGTQIPDSVRMGQRVAQTMGAAAAGGTIDVLVRAARAAGTWVSEPCRTRRRSSTTSP